MPDLTEKIGLGTVQFGTDYGIANTRGIVPKQEVNAILDLFKSRGGRILDTASAYGTAEEVLGSFDLNDFDVVSKWMPPAEGQSIADLLKESLTKLGLEKLYGYLAHRPLYVLDHPDSWQEVLQLKKQGLVRRIGFSLNRPEELKALEQAGITPDLIQVPYNYFDRRFDTVCLDFKEKGGEVHSRSAFLQGLFFVPSERLDPHFDEVKQILSRLQDDESNLAGELLGFALQNPWADAVIIGVDNVEQLLLNYKSLISVNGLPPFDKSISDSILIPSNWKL
jgi:aryl-alcohol dehydrogenase-like predicted oxidoreductase